MPDRLSELKDANIPNTFCPNCGDYPINPFMRGQVERRPWKLVLNHHYRDIRVLRYFTLRFNWWIPAIVKRPSLAVICYTCKEIIAWEDPEDIPRPKPDPNAEPTVIYMHTRQQVKDAALTASSASLMSDVSASCSSAFMDYGHGVTRQMNRTIKVKGRVTLSKKKEEPKEADDA